MIPRVTIKKGQAATGMLFSLLCIGSCAVTAKETAELPTEVAMSSEAGRGGLLFVNLRLEDGEELPFLLDTGTTGMVMDKSIESKLGRRLGTGIGTGWGSANEVDRYAAPKLYLGNMRLVTGKNVWVGESRKGGGPGILGMDCLKHYCIQLDFAKETIRFLNPDQVDPTALGKAYPLALKGNLPYIHHAGLLGGPAGDLLVDLGCRVDGMTGTNVVKGLAQFLPVCTWDGETYSNLAVVAVGHANVLGLNFFARHLVTLDFPRQTLYLKQTNVGPLGGGDSKSVENDETEAPVIFLEGLKEDGQLAGLSKDDDVTIYLDSYSNFDSPVANDNYAGYVKGYFNSRHKSATYSFRKGDDSSVCHYTVARASEKSPWQLEKAWQTDQSGKFIRAYPLP